LSFVFGCSLGFDSHSAKTECTLFAFLARKATTALVVSAFGFFVYIASRSVSNRLGEKVGREDIEVRDPGYSRNNIGGHANVESA
jgi:hypothetical protein